MCHCLSAGYDEIVDSPLHNMAYHRKLCLVVMTPNLDRISSSADGPQLIEKFYYKHNENGATYYLTRAEDGACFRDGAAVTFTFSLALTVVIPWRKKHSFLPPRKKNLKFGSSTSSISDMAPNQPSEAFQFKFKYKLMKDTKLALLRTRHRLKLILTETE